MTTESQPDLNSWDDFMGNWLKAEHIKSWPAEVVVYSVKGEFDDKDKAHLILDVAYNNRKYKWEPNVTNQQIIREMGIPSPKALEGKKIVFRKVMNFNPQIGRKVPSLEIQDIK